MRLREGCPRGHAAAAHDGHDGLSSLRKTCKLQPCVKLACVINADHVPISHVSGSHQVGRALHEVIIFIIIVTRQRCGGAMCSACTEPVVRSDGWYCTRRTCYATGATHTCRYARRSSRSRAKDATSCMTDGWPHERPQCGLSCHRTGTSTTCQHGLTISIQGRCASYVIRRRGSKPDIDRVRPG